MSRIYDSSHLIQRKAQQMIAGSFLTQCGSKPSLGIKDSSILYAVKEGSSTQFTRFDTCVGISPGCPCQALASSLAHPPYPGLVSGITFTVGSIIVSWVQPTTGDGPFTYTVTPYLNGVAQPSVVTSQRTHRFEYLQALQPYTFTVCAANAAGNGPVLTTPSFMAPPSELASILMGQAPPVDVAPSLMYVMNAGIDSFLSYAASINLPPTIGSRILYLWSASMAQAWNWVSSDRCVRGTQDGWNWDSKVDPLSMCDAILWMSLVGDHVSPLLFPGYVSPYSYSAADVTRVQAAGQWSVWLAQWNAWVSMRNADGALAASTAQPTTSANWNHTLVVDGVTVNDISAFPEPLQWTRLTVQTKQQKYLTYSWDSVTSTCMTAQNEADIQSSVGVPVTGGARDAEIDSVLSMSGTLTDDQKMQAEFWAGSSGGTISPPMMCVWLWKEYVRSMGVLCPTLVYSLLDLSIHLFEGARVTWKLKAAYMQDRPIQEIRRRYTGQSVASWNGTVDGAQWVPYQRASFVTPPFPDFPSGHSHFTKSFALTMTKWFGASIAKNPMVYDQVSLMSLLSVRSEAAYGDFLIAAGSSSIQSGPARDVSLSFSTWEEMADQAGMSRLYGGIHTISAHSSSQTCAVLVDGYINSTWNMTPPPMFAAVLPVTETDTSGNTDILSLVAASVAPLPSVAPVVSAEAPSN